MGLRTMRGKWQYRFRVQGHAVSVVTGLAAIERNVKKALAMEAAHKQAILEGRIGFRPLIPRSFSEALPEFEAWAKVEYAQHPATWRRIFTSMASARRFFGAKMLSMISPGDLERYKTWRIAEHGVQPVTLKHDLDNLSVFFAWCIRCEYSRENPAKSVSRPSDKDAVRQTVLTDAQEKLYFSHAGGNLWKIARLILLQGCRPAEVIILRKSDIDIERGTLQIRGGKSAAAKRTLKLTHESLSILAGQMSTLGPWVFPSPGNPERHITKLNCPHDRVCRRIGFGFVLYDLRHTFATRIAAAGVDAFALAAILGHGSTRILTRYVHPTQAHQDAAMALYDARNEQRRGETVQ